MTRSGGIHHGFFGCTKQTKLGSRPLPCPVLGRDYRSGLANFTEAYRLPTSVLFPNSPKSQCASVPLIVCLNTLSPALPSHGFSLSTGRSIYILQSCKESPGVHLGSALAGILTKLQGPPPGCWLPGIKQWAKAGFRKRVSRNRSFKLLHPAKLPDRGMAAYLVCAE